MTDRVNLDAQPRDIVGKQVKHLRREGWVPAIVYGPKGNQSIQVDKILMRRALRAAGTTNLIDLNVGKETHTVLVRDIQQHVTRGDVLHVDFLEVDIATTVTAEAELIPVGQAAPAADGLGVATMALRIVAIEARADTLISEIEVDLSRIETPDDVIYVSDLPVPEGVTILTDPETAVARFEYVQEEEEEEEEEEFFIPAADSVEVIGREEETEEEEPEEV